jgi:hypothetical protein
MFGDGASSPRARARLTASMRRWASSLSSGPGLVQASLGVGEATVTGDATRTAIAQAVYANGTR